MKASIKKKAKKVVTDLLASSVGQSWASIIADYIFDDVFEEMRLTMGEINEDDVNAESVKSRMGKVLDKLLYDF